MAFRNRGAVFLACGLAFLGVGAGIRDTAFLSIGPAFIGMGIAFLGRSRQRC